MAMFTLEPVPQAEPQENPVDNSTTDCACRAVDSSEFNDGASSWPGQCSIDSTTGKPWCYVQDTCTSEGGMGTTGGGKWAWCTNNRANTTKGEAPT